MSTDSTLVKRDRHAPQLAHLRPGLALAFAAATLLAMVCLGPLARATEPVHAAPDACVAGPHSGTISISQEWCLADSPHVVNGSLTIASGITLSLEAGVEVRFDLGTLLAVNDGGVLEAIGTPGQPITLTANSDSPVPGTWSYFIFRPGSHASLAYCDLAYAGRSSQPALYVDASDVQLSHCTLHDNLADAVQLRGAGLAPTLSDLTIAGNGGRAVYQDTVDMTPTYNNLSVSGNGTDAIVSAGGGLNRNATLAVAGSVDGAPLPYVWLSSVSVAGGYTLTIHPAVELRFATGLNLDIQANASLLAEGTPTQPITFTANLDAPVPGTWSYFIFRPGSHASLAYCDLAHAGRSSQPAVYVDASDVQLSHCTLHDNLADAIQVRGAGLAPTLADLTLANNGGRAVYQNTVDMTPAYNNLSVSGNGTDAIVSAGGGLNRNATLAVAGSVDGAPLPYVWLSSVSVAGGYTLTIHPAVELRFATGLTLDIQANASLLAEGAPTQPITFTANLTAPVPGTWSYFIFRPGSHASLAYCDLAYAGRSSQPAVYVDSSDVQVEFCRIHDNLDEGLEVRSSSQPLLRYNRIEGNGFGLRNDSPATAVDARENWWGDATGPYHPTLNPGGLGDAVSDGVLFDPWLGPYAYLWLEPQAYLLHGQETLSWFEFAAGQPVAQSVDIVAMTGEQPYTLGSGLPRAGELAWDTTAYADRWYELHAQFRDGGGQIVADVVKAVAVNNSPALAWHGGRLAANETWGTDRVHVVEADLTVPASVSLTVQAGTTVKFESAVGITVEDGGTLDTPATEDNPIVFTSLADDTAGGDTNVDGGRTLPFPGDWRGVAVQAGGQFLWNPYVQLRYLHVTHSGTLADDETWYGNTVHTITGDVTVPSGITLTLLPGAIVKFDTPANSKLGIRVNAGGSVVAQGGVAWPIVFTSIRDDAYGGDSNGDGNSTSPAAGDWRWLYVEGQATFDHVIVAYGAGTVSGNWDQTGALRTSASAEITLANSVVRDAFFDGVLAWGGPVAIENSLFTGIDRAICAHPGSVVSVVNTTLDTNRIALLNHGGTLNASNTLATNSLECGVMLDLGTIGSLTYNDVWSPSGADYCGLPDPTGTNGNISVDPGYKDREAGNLRLHYASPAIDAADGSLAPETDAMGAVRYDDPRSPNTGVPTPSGAYADMGAFEFVETAESGIDLAVSDVLGPPSAIAGETVTVTWTVTNLGAGSGQEEPGPESDPYTAIGPWHDTISLERLGETFLAGEVQVGYGVVLGPGESHTFSTQVRVPGGVDARYHWQATTNTRGEIFEGQNAANNSTLSAMPVDLAVPELVIDGPALGREFDEAGQPHWFKLSPPAAQDILIGLDLLGAGATELYVGRSYMPTTQQYDYRQVEWNSPDTTALVPNTLVQTYYILAYPRSLQGATGFSITAQASVFSLSSIDQAEAGDSGTLTLGIRGGLLEEGLSYEIVDPSGTPHQAGDVFVVNSSLVYATFEMSGLPQGLYDARVTKGPEIKTLYDVLNVVAAVPGEVEYRLSGPEATRPGWTALVTLEYENVGNTDIVAPIMQLKVEHAQSFPRFPAALPGDESWSSLESTETVSSSLLLGISQDGPAGILRPGEKGECRFTVIPTTDNLDVDVTLSAAADPDLEFDWNPFKEDLRPDWITAGTWDAIFENYTAQIGATVGQVERVLAESATYLSRLGIRSGAGVRLIAFEMEQAGMSKIRSRSFEGAFGFNNPAPWEVVAVTHPNGDVSIESASQIRYFAWQPDGTYRGGPGDVATLACPGGACLLREIDGQVIAFYPDGRLDYIEDTNGNRTTVVYSGARVTSITLSPSGYSLNLGYNGAGRINQTSDSLGISTSYGYDAANAHLTSITDPVGTVHLEYYVGEGAAREHAVKSVTLPDGVVRHFEYDEQGRLTKFYYGGGELETDVEYDTAFGVTVTDPAGSSHLLFSDFGAPAELTSPLGITQRALYDDEHRLTQRLLPLGAGYEQSYDAMGNLAQLLWPGGARADVAYDPTGARMVAATDPRNNTTQFQLDGNYNLTAIVHPDGRAERFSHDSSGSITAWTNGRGHTTEYAYGLYGRLDEVTTPDGSISYQYDGHNNLLSVTNSAGTTSFTYDAADRVTRVTYPSGKYLAYTYDAGGRRSQMVDQDGFTVKYSYDGLGRLDRLTDAGGSPFAAYTYDAAGRVVREDRGNGTYTTYEKDAAGRLVHLVNYGPAGTVHSRFDYSHDDLGQRVTVTTLEGTISYEYDSAGQLKGVALPAGRILQYQYDAAGNRTFVVDGGATIPYATNDADQYTSAGPASFGYDADGNLVSRSGEGTAWTYTYDDQNHLLSASAPGDTWSYEYDGLGHLIAATHNGQQTEYVIDPLGGGMVVGEYSADNLIAHYLYGAGLVGRADAAGSRAYFGFDGAWNTVEMTDEVGNVVNSYAYLPFGELLGSSETIPNPFTFGGRSGVLDGGGNLFFMRNRWYDPGLGRFVQRDPVGLGGGDMNLYRYAGNRPTNASDPSGLCSWSDDYLTSIQQGLFTGAQDYRLGELYFDVFSPKQHLGVDGWTVTRVSSDLGGGVILLTSGNAVGAAEVLVPETGAVSVIDEARWTMGKGGVKNFVYRTTYRSVLKWAPRALWGPIGTGLRAGGWGLVAVGASEIVNMYARTWGYNPRPEQIFPEDKLYRAFKVMLNQRDKIKIRLEKSKDPNDIAGPGGYGELHYIAGELSMPYTIRFENVITATASAQTVVVTLPLDENLDWSTFRLDALGFGDHALGIPAGLQSYSQRVDVRDEFGLYVDISAALDADAGVVTWEFVSIDPVTNEPTRDPLAGFLPPNQMPPEGQGYVTYVVDPRDTLVTGDPVEAQATIVFDTNDPIATNLWLNTLDTDAPASYVNTLPAVSRPTFLVSWAGSDAGSGVAYYDVYVSVDERAFVPWQTYVTTTQATFSGEGGHSYRFYSVATDGVGHREAAPSVADAETSCLYGVYLPLVVRNFP